MGSVDKIGDNANSEAATAMKILLEKLSKKELISIRDLVEKLVLEKEPNAREVIKIPIEIFSAGLNAVEALTKYLKENLDKSYSEISLLLEKKENTVWLNYSRAHEKMKQPFKLGKSEMLIPLSVLVSEKLSLVESLVRYLRDERYISNKDTAKLLGTSDVVVSTAYNRMKVKVGR